MEVPQSDVPTEELEVQDGPLVPISLQDHEENGVQA